MPESISQNQLRYSRHTILPQFGEDGQRRLAAARVLIIGLGGLGSPAAMYLAAAGVGQLALSDFDRVDITNLQRQILYRTPDLKHAKTSAATHALKALNPEVELIAIDKRLQHQELAAEVEKADVVLDASDNFGTRFALNDASVHTRTPLVSGAAIRFEGQLAVFDPNHTATACYACLYPEDAEGLDNCRNNGVLAPMVGVIGSMMAVETIKILAGAGEPATGCMLLYDALRSRWRRIALPRDPTCRVCGSLKSSLR